MQKASEQMLGLGLFCITANTILYFSALFGRLYVRLVFDLGLAVIFEYLCWLFIGCLAFSLVVFSVINFCATYC